MLGHFGKYRASSSPPRLARTCHPTRFSSPRERRRRVTS